MKKTRNWQDSNRGKGRRSGPWDVPTRELLRALNWFGSVSRAAAVLNTTPTLLRDVLEQKGIVKEWVVEAGPEAARGDGD